MTWSMSARRCARCWRSRAGWAYPRLAEGRGGILFVGPSRPYLAYVADVLPSLGEEGVQTCTLRDLLPEGATAPDETDPEVARLKSTAEMVTAIEPAVRLYEEPPTTPQPLRAKAPASEQSTKNAVPRDRRGTRPV